jgi:hypothetical protein
MDGRELLDQISVAQVYTVTKLEAGSKKPKVPGRDSGVAAERRAADGPARVRHPALDPTCTPFQPYDSGDPTSRTVGCYDEGVHRALHQLARRRRAGLGGAGGRLLLPRREGDPDILNLARRRVELVKVNGTRLRSRRVRRRRRNVFTGFTSSRSRSSSRRQAHRDGRPPGRRRTPGDDTLLAIP